MAAEQTGADNKLQKHSFDTMTADAADAMTADAMTADAMTADAMTADAMTADAMTADAMTADAMTADAIASRLSTIRPRVPSSVKLIAVTKTFPSEIVRAAYAAGIRDFAENKVQESVEKQAQLADLTDVVWHFIGHIQSNKSRKVVEHFDWIHSVDSLKLAARLDRHAAELGKQPTCCLQVKLAIDPTKDGFERADLLAAVPELDQLMHLNIVGLMVIAPYGLSPAATQKVFERGQDLATEIKALTPNRLRMDELSMGMSGDFEWAIAAGATMIRLGSSLFGARQR
ncbi:MAG: pyridoxal phosphate enzyme, YggS family [Phormidesmis priestleyi Ana]|uniref:Pyridoxal phosphate homeostasis protein n=1 Tax=Phormidesmis priestleyi Ana TaxID=1666911 RepID=A0A0P7ZLB5_9CYAN|nr:MAG: pyridoxal phosphate enzyme, YggS family [Phormidesmis priestleyi Ana]